MAKGVQRLLKSDCSIATSGIAGPLGGTVDKPVGTVWIAVVYKTKIITYKQQGDDGREINIIKACGNALRILKEVLVDKY
jgi:nicotinamide mononucleotide (NMN) deamidase PncC